MREINHDAPCSSPLSEALSVRSLLAHRSEFQRELARRAIEHELAAAQTSSPTKTSMACGKTVANSITGRSGSTSSGAAGSPKSVMPKLTTAIRTLTWPLAVCVVL